LGYYNLTPRIYERICGHLSGRSEPERMEELLTSAEGTMPLCGSCQSLGAYVATGNPRGVQAAANCSLPTGPSTPGGTGASAATATSCRPC